VLIPEFPKSGVERGDLGGGGGLALCGGYNEGKKDAKKRDRAKDSECTARGIRKKKEKTLSSYKKGVLRSGKLVPTAVVNGECKMGDKEGVNRKNRPWEAGRSGRICTRVVVQNVPNKSWESKLEAVDKRGEDEEEK